MRYLAFDIGAESGRAVIGDLRDGQLDIEEVHRFANGPIRAGDRLHWDALGLWRDIKLGMRIAAQRGAIHSVGVDTWGVDYALLDARGEVIGNPVCYRDARTNGMLERAEQKVGREFIFNHTGVQFMSINTLYHLMAERAQRAGVFDLARSFVMMPDLFHFWMTGQIVNEYSNASTTQLLDMRTGQWSAPLLDAFDIPRALFSPPAMPGAKLGKLRTDVAEDTGIGDAAVVLPGTHDTASAVVATPLNDSAGEFPAYISSGTWSLVGVELDAPVITPEALRANMTNEGGAGGKIRLLKNVMGLWLLQQCRAEWAREGRVFDYADLTRLADEAAHFRSVIDAGDEAFLNPPDMRHAIRDACASSSQAAPETPGEFARCIFVSLAQAYRRVLSEIERVTGRRVTEIHIAGGGARNALLNRLTAQMCERPVFVGPIECTAIGNVLVQAIGMGELVSLREAREVVRRSFDVARIS